MTPDVPPPPAAPTNPPAAPPGLVPSAPPLPPAPPSGQPPVALPAGYTRARGITISPKVVAWLPAVLLTITLLCTFFPWVGSYFGGYPVQSQNLWRAMFGTTSRNFALEEKSTIPIGWMEKLKSDWELLLPAVLALILAVLFAWADRGLRGLDPQHIPPLAKVWSIRRLIILALAVASFLFLFSQVGRGLGMERAIRQTVRENPALAKEREEAGNSQWKLAALENREEQELAKYNLERTTWLYLGLTCNLLAVLAMLAHMALNRRGDKPPPRFVIQY